MSADVTQRPRDGRGRFLPSRIGADGLVGCGMCGQRKPPHAFPTTTRGYPDSYCCRCRSRRATRDKARRAARDPVWYTRRIRERTRNRARQRRRVGDERLQLAQGAIAWMTSRGFWQKEIAALVECTPDTVRHWRAGRFGGMGHPSVGERLTALHRVTGDIPAWRDRDRVRDKTHPWLSVVAARLAEMTQG